MLCSRLILTLVPVFLTSFPYLAVVFISLPFVLRLCYLPLRVLCLSFSPFSLSISLAAGCCDCYLMLLVPLLFFILRGRTHTHIDGTSLPVCLFICLLVVVVANTFYTIQYSGFYPVLSCPVRPLPAPASSRLSPIRFAHSHSPTPVCCYPRCRAYIVHICICATFPPPPPRLLLSATSLSSTYPLSALRSPLLALSS